MSKTTLKTSETFLAKNSIMVAKGAMTMKVRVITGKIEIEVAIVIDTRKTMIKKVVSREEEIETGVEEIVAASSKIRST